MERATCLLWSQSVPSPYRNPAGPRTGQTFTLSRIDWSCLLPHGTDHLFSGWYKWNWLEHGLIDLLTHVSWHSGDDQAWRERRTITWSLPGPQTRGIIVSVLVSTSVPPHLRMWQRVLREKHMLHSFAFYCVCKNCSSQKRGDKWWCDAYSPRSHYAALIYSVWDFDLNAGVCAANAADVLVWRVSAIQVILMSPLHLWLTLFQTTKWCVSFSWTMIKGAGVLREACLKRINLVTRIVLYCCTHKLNAVLQMVISFLTAMIFLKKTLKSLD